MADILMSVFCIYGIYVLRKWLLTIKRLDNAVSDMENFVKEERNETEG